MRRPPYGVPSVGQYDHERYRNVGTYYAAGPISRCTNATQIMEQNILNAQPIVFPRGGTIDSAGVYCTNWGGSGMTRSVRVGLYDSISNTDLYPNNRIATTGIITFSSTGLKVDLTFAATVQPNVLYWGVTVSTVTVEEEFVYGDAYLVSTDTDYECPIPGFSNTFQGSSGFYVAFAWAALPLTYPAGPTFSTGLYDWCPLFRIAS